jgi:xanthine dehydrogenase accessory factor
VKEILNDVDSWLGEGKTDIALATVVQTWGSAPRRTGAKMAITADGRISGSVSGGCVEGAVIEAAKETIHSGLPQLLHFGVADEAAWEVGLACGGTIDIYVDLLDEPTYQFAQQQISNNQTGFNITVIQGPDPILGSKATFDGDQLWMSIDNLQLAAEINKVLPDVTKSQRIKVGEEIELFLDFIQPSPTLIVVGGVHIAIALTAMAKMLDFRTVVIDPRRAFGSQERFQNVDLLIQKWPQKAFEELELSANTAVALLTHDPKIDDPALKVLLDSTVFYIGALGSRKTHARRVERLSQMGFDQARISRIHAPIGVDIGADTPEEIAVAILAEIVSARHSNVAYAE